MLNKYNRGGKGPVALELMRHLFHGTKVNHPSKIYSTEDGMDMRYSNDGLNGFGLYFADNAKYSDDYAHKVQGYDGEKQMFLCLVLTGLSAEFGGGHGVRMPPLRN
jgi:Poly(ADP-ribose) polymerase catalytic domain